MTRADSSLAHWGPMTSRALGCASWRSAQAAIMGPRLSCCTSLRPGSRTPQEQQQGAELRTPIPGMLSLARLSDCPTLMVDVSTLSNRH